MPGSPPARRWCCRQSVHLTTVDLSSEVEVVALTPRPLETIGAAAEAVLAGLGEEEDQSLHAGLLHAIVCGRIVPDA